MAFILKHYGLRDSHIALLSRYVSNQVDPQRVCLYKPGDAAQPRRQPQLFSGWLLGVVDHRTWGAEVATSTFGAFNFWHGDDLVLVIGCLVSCRRLKRKGARHSGRLEELINSRENPFTAHKVKNCITTKSVFDTRGALHSLAWFLSAHCNNQDGGTVMFCFTDYCHRPKEYRARPPLHDSSWRWRNAPEARIYADRSLG